MGKRIASNIYTFGRIWTCNKAGDISKLYSMGKYETKLKKRDLPDYFINARYCGAFGLVSTKGVKQLVYNPNMNSNHMFRDDYLYISYNEDNNIVYDTDTDMYKGYDLVINGYTIIRFLRACEINSNYNIDKIKEQIEEKRITFKAKYPTFYEYEVRDDVKFF